METIYFYSALVGGCFLVLQTIMLVIGIGGDTDTDASGADADLGHADASVDHVDVVSCHNRAPVRGRLVEAEPRLCLVR